MIDIKGVSERDAVTLSRIAFPELIEGGAGGILPSAFIIAEILAT